MRRIAPVLVAFSALVFTGCILFGIGDLTGGNASDGGSSSDDGSGGDAIGSSDASSVDGASIDSSTTDGGNEGGRFCPQIGALLCSDFDDPDIDASVPGPWDYAYGPGTTQIADTTAQFKSAPRSLIVSTIGTALAAGLSKDVLGKHIDLSFDLYIMARGGNPGFATFTVGGAGAITFQPTSDTQSGILEADRTADGGTIYNGTTGVTIPITKWVHVDCVMDLPTRVATLSINGAVIVTRTIENTTNWTTAKNVSIALGFGDSNDETLYYDNVTITAM